MYLLNVLLFTMVMSGSGFGVDDVESLIGPVDSSCLWIQPYQQSFLADVEMYSVDTGCNDTSLPRPNYKPFRLAVDAQGATYKLFNFSSSEFNDMMTKHPVELIDEDVYDFGRFFLQLTRIYDPFGDTYFISSTAELKTLNKEYTELTTRPDDFKIRSERIERIIDSVCAHLDFDRVVHGTEQNTYEVDYYTWQLQLGELRNITLTLTSRGIASIRSDTVITTHLGYYHPGVL